MSECRDLLFHVQEHLFSLPEIEQALEHLNLAFLGFEMQDKTTLMKFRASYADKDAMNSITQWHQFEIEHPNSFAGMYQFWCQKT